MRILIQSVGLGQDLRFCIADKLTGVADAGCAVDRTLSIKVLDGGISKTCGYGNLICQDLYPLPGW